MPTLNVLEPPLGGNTLHTKAALSPSSSGAGCHPCFHGHSGRRAPLIELKGNSLRNTPRRTNALDCDHVRASRFENPPFLLSLSKVVGTQQERYGGPTDNVFQLSILA